MIADLMAKPRSRWMLHEEYGIWSPLTRFTKRWRNDVGFYSGGGSGPVRAPERACSHHSIATCARIPDADDQAKTLTAHPSTDQARFDISAQYRFDPKIFAAVGTSDGQERDETGLAAWARRQPDAARRPLLAMLAALS